MSIPPQTGLNPTALSWNPTLDNNNNNNGNGNSNSTPQPRDSSSSRGRGRGRGRSRTRGGRGGQTVNPPRAAQGDNISNGAAIVAADSNNNVPSNAVSAPSSEATVSVTDNTSNASNDNASVSSNRGRGGRGGRRGGSNTSASSSRGRGGARGGLTAAGTVGSSIAPPRAFGHRLTGAPGASSGAPTSAGGAGGPSSRSRPNRANRARAPSTSSAATSAATADTSSPTGPPSTAHDLMTRIHEDIDSNNYDCPICLAPVTRSCQIWSCTMCYHVAHFSCVASWLDQAVTEQHTSVEQIRCPACNKPAALSAPAGGATAAISAPDQEVLDEEAATEAWALFFFSLKPCWCEANKAPSSLPMPPGGRGSRGGRGGRAGRAGLSVRGQAAPSPMSLAPHSCGRVCGRQRGPDGCEHPCTHVCHAGPCPPCPEMGPLTACLCGGETRIRPCSAPDARKLWVCGKPCNRKLDCGEHFCKAPCHAGDCAPCIVPVSSRCFCGKQQQDMPCSTRQPPQPSFSVFSDSSSPSAFNGVFACDEVCGRAFDCGVHTCSKPCHAQDATTPHCPASPDAITRCPCGKTRLADASANLTPRTKCTDPVPTCGQTCDKAHDSCGHACTQLCHTGACPPCAVVVDQRCACESTSAPFVCSDSKARDEFRCETPCRTTLGCKQHRCNVVCCPGKPKAAALAAALRAEKPRGQRGPRGSRQQQASQNNTNVVEEHQCPRPCGRLQKCGKHACPLPCHSGPCPSCVAYELDNMQCSCGHVLLEAPFLCGTPVPVCDLDCPRPLVCGHVPVPHRCHDDTETSCPRCPRLVSKSCLCGKLVLGRVACGADNIQCSNVCGAMLACGVHTCRKACHRPGECEDVTVVNDEGKESSHCSQTCNRPKPVCGHPCTDRCHGIDANCQATEPCGAAVEVHCPCGRLARKVRCNACVNDPAPTHRHPVCDDECLRVQRNLQLRDALRISDGYKDEHLSYAHDLMEVYLNNRAFVAAQEKTLRTTFAAPSPNATAEGASTPVVINFKPMKRRERQIVHMLAETFSLRSESRDSEPHRHVVVSRLVRSAPSFPSLTIPESEEIYCRLRDKAKAEADAAAVAALAAREAKVASEEAAAQRRAARKRLFNAVFVPATVKEAVVADSGVDADHLISADVFKTIVEAWQGQQMTSSASSATLQQHTIIFGDVVLRVLVPATAPAIVQQLTAFLLTYAEALWDVNPSSSSDARLALCHVDAQHNILRMGGHALEEEENNEIGRDGGDDEDAETQWNVVAAVSSPSLSRRASADLTTATPSDSSAPALQQQQSKRSQQTVTRGMLTLKKKNVRPASPTGAKRKQWMDILASQPTDDEEEEDEEEEAEVEVKEVSKEGESTGVDEEEVRTALEQVLLDEDQARA
ncbi:FKBP12-associated protein [Sporothrix bragantina]|uniref:FKBP12-associated protein n=1 Tax=Sporothrix bragantina TaxID=671064 RepID=A0ABP0B6N7_9PEZI